MKSEKEILWFEKKRMLYLVEDFPKFNFNENEENY